MSQQGNLPMLCQASPPPGILILLQDVYVLQDYLCDTFKIPKKTIFNGISLYKNKQSANWQFVKINTGYWIRFDSIPTNTKSQYQLPANNEIVTFCAAKSTYNDYCEKKELTAFINVQLTIAISEYNRFIPYYRELELRHDRMASMAKTHALFDLLSNLKKFTLLELFQFYNEVIDDTFSFKTTNFDSFCRKLRDIKKRGIVDALMPDNLGNHNATKIRPLHKSLVLHYYRHGAKLSYREITSQVNTALILKGLPLISISLVKHLLQDKLDKNLSDIYRNGKKWAKDQLLPFLIREAAKYPGDQFQIDGTRLQILYKNEKGKLAFLYMVCVLDCCSKKLVGYALGEKESGELYVQALQMAFKKCNYLPAEILRDNLKSFKKENSELKDLIEQTWLLGVQWRALRWSNKSGQ